ncbi:hypothetical protein BKA82DRAFT_3133314 [Pisolithus tinctorius]|nr:hypothetical protein BKA82DRAFT_3133314 [Pisolithus tinctorius]
MRCPIFCWILMVGRIDGSVQCSQGTSHLSAWDSRPCPVLSALPSRFVGSFESWLNIVVFTLHPVYDTKTQSPRSRSPSQGSHRPILSRRTTQNRHRQRRLVGYVVWGCENGRSSRRMRTGFSRTWLLLQQILSSSASSIRPL